MIRTSMLGSSHDPYSGKTSNEDFVRLFQYRGPRLIAIVALLSPLQAAIAQVAPDIQHVIEQMSQHREAIRSAIVEYEWTRENTQHTGMHYATHQYAITNGNGILHVDGDFLHREVHFNRIMPNLGTADLGTQSIVMNDAYSATTREHDPAFVYQYESLGGPPHSPGLSTDGPRILGFGYLAFGGVDLASEVQRSGQSERWSMETVSHDEFGMVYHIRRSSADASESYPYTDYYIDPDAGYLLVGMDAYNSSGALEVQTRIEPISLSDGTWFPGRILHTRKEYTNETRIVRAQVNTDIPRSQFELESLAFDRERSVIVRQKDYPDGEISTWHFNSAGELIPDFDGLRTAEVQAMRVEQPISSEARGTAQFAGATYDSKLQPAQNNRWTSNRLRLALYAALALGAFAAYRYLTRRERRA